MGKYKTLWLLKNNSLKYNYHLFQGKKNNLPVVLAPITAKHRSWMFVFVRYFTINCSNNTEISIMLIRK
jgi:hypothetical protein